MKKKTNEEKIQDGLQEIEMLENSFENNIEETKILIDKIKAPKKTEESDRDIILFKTLNKENKPSVVIAVNAEGLEVAEHSLIGAKIAALESIQYLDNVYSRKMEIREKDVEIAMASAWSALNVGHVQKEKLLCKQFATTLSISVYDIEKQELIYGSNGKTNLTTMSDTGQINHYVTTDEENNTNYSLMNIGNSVVGTLSNISAFSLMSKSTIDRQNSNLEFFKSLFYNENFDQEINAKEQNHSFIRILNQKHMLNKEEFFSNECEFREQIDPFGLSMTKRKILLQKKSDD